MRGIIALSTLGIAGLAGAQIVNAGPVTNIYQWTLSSQTNPPQPSPYAVYSNITQRTGFGYQGFHSNSSTGIVDTAMYMDLVHQSVATSDPITGITWTYWAYQNRAVTAAPCIGFYSVNPDGTVGSIIAGVVMDTVTSPASGFGEMSVDGLGHLGVVLPQDYWMGLFWRGTLSNVQNMGIVLFDAPTVGTRSPVDITDNAPYDGFASQFRPPHAQPIGQGGLGFQVTTPEPAPVVAVGFGLVAILIRKRRK